MDLILQAPKLPHGVCNGITAVVLVDGKPVPGGHVARLPSCPISLEVHDQQSLVQVRFFAGAADSGTSASAAATGSGNFAEVSMPFGELRAMGSCTASGQVVLSVGLGAPDEEKANAPVGGHAQRNDGDGGARELQQKCARLEAEVDDLRRRLATRGGASAGSHSTCDTPHWASGDLLQRDKTSTSTLQDLLHCALAADSREANTPKVVVATSSLDGDGGRPWPRDSLDQLPVSFKCGRNPACRILMFGDECVAGRCTAPGGGSGTGGFAFEPPGRALSTALQAAGISCEVAVCGLVGVPLPRILSEVDAPSMKDEVGHVCGGLAQLLEGGPYDMAVLMVGPDASAQPATVYTELCRLHQVFHARKIVTLAVMPPSSPGSAAGPAREKLSRQTLCNLLDRWVRATSLAIAFHDLTQFGWEDSSRNLARGQQLWDESRSKLTAAGFRDLGRQLADLLTPHLGGLAGSPRAGMPEPLAPGELPLSRVVSECASRADSEDHGKTPRSSWKTLRGKEAQQLVESHMHAQDKEELHQARQAVSRLESELQQAAEASMLEAHAVNGAAMESLAFRCQEATEANAQLEAEKATLEARAAEARERGEAAIQEHMEALAEMRLARDKAVRESAASAASLADLRAAYKKCQKDVGAALSQALASETAKDEKNEELQRQHEAYLEELQQRHDVSVQDFLQREEELQRRHDVAIQDLLQREQALTESRQASEQAMQETAESFQALRESYRECEADAENALQVATQAAAKHGSEIARHNEAYQELHREHAAALQEVAQREEVCQGLNRDHAAAVQEVAQREKAYREELHRERAAAAQEAGQREEVVLAELQRVLDQATQRETAYREELHREHATTTQEAAQREEALVELQRARDQGATGLQELREAFWRHEADAAVALSQATAIHDASVAHRDKAHEELQRKHAAAIWEVAKRDEALAELRLERDRAAQEAARRLEQLKEVDQKREYDLASHSADAAQRQEAYQELQRRYEVALEDVTAREKALVAAQNALHQAALDSETKLKELQDACCQKEEDARASLCKAIASHSSEVSRLDEAFQVLQRKHASALGEVAQREQALAELRSTHDQARQELQVFECKAQEAVQSHTSYVALHDEALASHNEDVARHEEAYQELQRRHAAALEEVESGKEVLADHLRISEEASREGASTIRELQKAHRRCEDNAASATRELQEAHRRCEDNAASATRQLQETYRKCEDDAASALTQVSQALEIQHAAAAEEAVAFERVRRQLQTEYEAAVEEVASREEAVEGLQSELQAERELTCRARSDASAAKELAAAAKRRAGEDLKEARKVQDDLDRKVLQAQAHGVRSLSEMHQVFQEDLEVKTAELRAAQEQSQQANHELQMQHLEELSKRDDALLEMKRARDRAVEQGNAGLEELQGAMAECKQRAALELSQVEGDHAASVDELREAYQEELQRSCVAAEQQIARHEAACQELQRSHQAVARDAADQEEAYQKLQKSHAAVMEDVANQEKAYWELQREHAAVMQEASNQEEAYQVLQKSHAAAALEAAKRDEAMLELRLAHERATQEEANSLRRVKELQGELHDMQNAASTLSQAVSTHGCIVAEREAAYQELLREHAASLQEVATREEAMAEMQRAHEEAVREGTADLEELRQACCRCEEDAAAALSQATARHSADVDLRDEAYLELQQKHAAALQDVVEREEAAAELQRAREYCESQVPTPTPTNSWAVVSNAQNAALDEAYSELQIEHSTAIEEVAKRDEELTLERGVTEKVKEKLEHSQQELTQARMATKQIQEQWERAKQELQQSREQLALTLAAVERERHESDSELAASAVESRALVGRLRLEQQVAEQELAAERAASAEAEQRRLSDQHRWHAGCEELERKCMEEVQRLQLSHHDERAADQEALERLEIAHEQCLGQLVALGAEHAESQDAAMLTERFWQAHRDEQCEIQSRQKRELEQHITAVNKAKDEMLGLHRQHVESDAAWRQKLAETELRNSVGWELAEHSQEELQQVVGKLRCLEDREADCQLTMSAMQAYENAAEKSARQQREAISLLTESEEACARKLSREQAKAADLEVRLFAIHAELRTEKSLATAARPDVDALASIASSREEDCKRLRSELSVCREEVCQAKTEVHEFQQAQARCDALFEKQERQLKMLREKSRKAEMEALERGGEAAGLREALAGQLQAAATMHERELSGLSPARERGGALAGGALAAGEPRESSVMCTPPSATDAASRSPHASLSFGPSPAAAAAAAPARGAGLAAGSVTAPLGSSRSPVATPSPHGPRHGSYLELTGAVDSRARRNLAGAGQNLWAV